MNDAAGPPSKWAIRFSDGSMGTVWADAFAIVADEYVFENLMDASAEEQAQLDILARAPSDPARVRVVVARLPVRLVENLWTAE